MPPFHRLGHYRVVERIGAGGMGDVYRGHDDLLDRSVAIKVLPAELALYEEFVLRFRREATAAARVSHPNVVPIHFIGQEGGNHFFVMQLIEGESLADRLANRGRLPPEEALDVIAQCLSGLGAAHVQGLIHRDIKPGNVLLEAKTGRAMLADFGLVRRIEQTTRLTLTGVILGTVDYMAPEQVRAQAIDARADLYSLGVLFYQMLSGRLPYRAETPAAMMFQHAHQPPVPLDEVAPETPPAVGRIVARMMAKNPGDRYANCQEALAEVRAARHGLPLECLLPTVRRPQALVLLSIESQQDAVTLPEGLEPLTSPGGWRYWCQRAVYQLDCLLAWEERTRRWLGRLETTTQQVESVVAQYQQRCEELRRMEEEAQVVAAALTRQIEEIIAAGIEARRDALAAGQSDGARIARAQAEAYDDDLAAMRLQLKAQQIAIEEISLDRSKAEAAHARLRLQMDLLAARLKAAEAARRRFGVSAAAVRHRRWIAAVVLMGLFATVVAIGFQLVARAMHGSRPALTEEDLAARVPPGEVQLLGRWSDAFGGLALAADGSQVLAGTAGGSLVVREASDGKELAQSGASPAAAQVIPGRCEVAVTADGTRAAFAGEDGTVHLWDVATKKKTCTIATGMGRVAGLAFSPDGSSVLIGGGSHWTGTSGEPLLVCDAVSGTPMRRHGLNGCRVDAVAWSPDGRHLLAAVDDRTIRLLDALTGEEIGRMVGHQDQVVRVKFLPDGHRALSAGRDTTIRLWDLSSGSALAVLAGHAAAVNDVAISRDGRYVLSAGADGSVRLWNLDRQGDVFVLQGHTDAVTGVVFLPDERFALSSSRDGTIRRWRVPVLTADSAEENRR